MYAQFIRVDDAKLAELIDKPVGVQKFIAQLAGVDPSVVLDIDKTWAGIHFLLTGEPFIGDLPLGFILSGPPLGDEDLGMGPALVKRAITVKAIAEALTPITEETIRERYNHEEMIQEEIYAMGGNSEDDLEYLIGGFVALREFILSAANSGSGILHFIS